LETGSLEYLLQLADPMKLGVAAELHFVHRFLSSDVLQQIADKTHRKIAQQGLQEVWKRCIRESVTTTFVPRNLREDEVSLLFTMSNVGHCIREVLGSVVLECLTHSTQKEFCDLIARETPNILSRLVQYFVPQLALMPVENINIARNAYMKVKQILDEIAFKSQFPSPHLLKYMKYNSKNKLSLRTQKNFKSSLSKGKVKGGERKKWNNRIFS